MEQIAGSKHSASDKLELIDEICSKMDSETTTTETVNMIEKTPEPSQSLAIFNKTHYIG